MTIDWWTLGLQAVNVLILVWLLSRIFWRPVAAAITRRQDTVEGMLKDAKATQAKADDMLAEVLTAREGMAAERNTLLSEAALQAEGATKTALQEAASKAEALLKAAQLESVHINEANRMVAAAQSAQLAVDIARKLLARLDAGKAKEPFLDQLIDALDTLPAKDKAALAGATGGVDLISASELDSATRMRIETAVAAALDGQPQLNFHTDPALIAGFELRTRHFVLQSSWAADLDAILRDLKDAA